MSEVTTTLKSLQSICGWHIEDHEDLNTEVTITWNHSGWVRMYNTTKPDGGFFGLNIDYDIWIDEDLPALQDANELWNEKY